jgi:hypothetical protein
MKYINVLFLSIAIVGCSSSPLKPYPGMTLKQFESMSIRSVLGDISKFGNHPELPQVEIWETFDQQYSRKYRIEQDINGKGFFYFLDGKLISNSELNKMLEINRKKKQEEIEKENNRKLKEAELEEQRIKELENNKAIEFYNRQERYAQQERKNRIEKEQEEKINKLLNDKNLRLIYRDGDFVISKNKFEKIIFLKNGRIVSAELVKDDIAKYNSLVKANRDFELLKAKNLSEKWVVSARGVGYCVVTSIKEIGREFDGAAIFSIATSCRNPRFSSGSYGSSNIICGYDRTNYVNMTTHTASCQ